VTVSVVNKDEVAPSFTSATTGSALENQAALYTAVSTDTVDYVGGSTSYSLVAGGDAAALTINASTGEVTLASGTLDYETKKAYTFTVRATDAAGNTADRAVTVSVVNKDEVAPSFTSATTGSALENQAALYTAVSTDTVDYVGGSTSYSL